MRPTAPTSLVNHDSHLAKTFCRAATELSLLAFLPFSIHVSLSHRSVHAHAPVLSLARYPTELPMAPSRDADSAKPAAASTSAVAGAGQTAGQQAFDLGQVRVMVLFLCCFVSLLSLPLVSHPYSLASGQS